MTHVRHNGGVSEVGYPLLLDVAGRRVVVVGGGAVGTRRVTGLLESGADVLVVSPAITAEIAALGVAIEQRGFHPADLDDAWLAVACTDSPDVNAAVAAADVVVVDRLAPRGVLDELPADVEVIDCGKSAHRQNMTQSEINDVLVERALAGKRVVRLKGGDPFVFGRGGEEWLACVAAGIPVTVVPGISSALAAPAAAGIPLTHRGVAADFTVVSGHLDPGRAPDDVVNWPGLAAITGTLVLLMAMDRLDAIAQALIKHGRAASTPTAVVRRATLPDQQVVRAPLSEIAAAAAHAGVRSPAVVVVGDVVDVLRDVGNPNI